MKPVRQIVIDQEFFGPDMYPQFYDRLPPPPAGKTGWPWTATEDWAFEVGEEQEQSNLPTIGIVTPSFNQGEFLEETIRSVLLQGYPNLEYVVIDGGSTDDSLAIIRKYSDFLTFWRSEPDGGQSAAINYGHQKLSGEVACWLNSDDYFHPNALFALAEAYRHNPDAVVWVGACSLVERDGHLIENAVPEVGSASKFANWGRAAYTEGECAWVPQPSCFYRREDFLNIGGLNEDLYFTLDVDLWIKLARLGLFYVLPEVISAARIYEGIKTSQNYPGRMAEHIVINWAAGEREAGRMKMVEFGTQYGRGYVLAMRAPEFFLLVLTWIYRRTLKPIVNWAKSYRSRNFLTRL